MKALRTVAGVFLGLMLALILLSAVELFGSVFHPVPENFGGTMEEMCRHVEKYPQWILAVVVPMWGITALASTWTAQRIGGLNSTIIVGLLLLAGLLYNVSKLPYPIWFKVANVFVIPAAIYAGYRLAIPRKAASASTGEDGQPAAS
jgi:hypothetical protein